MECSYTQPPQIRVVFILPTYLPESFGGAEQQTRKLAIAFRRAGHAVTILAPRLRSSTAPEELDNSIVIRRFRVAHGPHLGGRYIGSLLKWSVQISWWLFRHRNRFDVIHVIHGRLHGLSAVLTAALLGKPALVKIGRGGAAHFDIDILSRKRLVGRWYVRWMTRYATAYVANSKEIVGDLLRWKIPNSRIHQIPNGVEIPPFAAYPNDRCIHFIYLGRLDPEKAVDLMIRGFAQLPSEIPAKLSIVGDGTCRSELEQLVSTYELQSRVFFTGATNDVSGALRRSDVFVSTSLSEGMSNSLLEAMSHGVMPLVSRVSGVDDIVENGRSGVLFRPGDLDDFVAKINEVARLPASTRQEFGSHCRAALVHQFSIDRIAALHIELYRRLQESPPNGGNTHR